MKRCPKCRRDYTDETLNYCLDDGVALLDGPGSSGEPATRIMVDADTTFVEAVEHEQPESKNKPPSSIAVLPFVHLSADPDDEYFCDGLAEELLNALSKVEGLNVASRTSAFSFKGKNATIREVAEALGVSSVLEGSVRRSGNRLRIGVQLINAADDRRVWTERFDREMKDVFDIQDEIALSVVDALKVELLGDERTAMLKRYTNNPLAYQLFLKGRFHWYKHTPEDVKKSASYFEQAIEVDPNYAPGYAGLGEFYGLSAAIGTMDPSVAWPLAERALVRAKALDDSIPEVHNGFGAIRGFYYRDFSGAELELQRAKDLNPRFSEAHSLHSFFLTGQGRAEDAIAEGTAALELEPLSISYHRYLGWWFYFARRWDDAIEKYDKVIGMDDHFVQAYEDLRDALICKGDRRGAVQSWRKQAVLTEDDELLSILEADIGRAIAGASELCADRLIKRLDAGEWVAPAELARWYVRMGDRDEAFAWLKRASGVRDWFSVLLPADPLYDPLRGDPRFDSIVAAARLTE